MNQWLNGYRFQPSGELYGVYFKKQWAIGHRVKAML